MITPDALAQAAQNLEAPNIERKESFSDPRAIEEAICAMSNDIAGLGKGLILIGVTDKTGRPSERFEVTDQLLLTVNAIRHSGNILPFPLMTVSREQLNGRDIIVIEVEPSHEPPVQHRGVVRVRTGPNRGIATRDQVRILTERRRGWDLPFDQRAISGTTLRDLDMDLFTHEYLPSAVDPSVIRENGRSLAEQLSALHLASPDGVPTVTGMLILGHSPTTWLPGAYVQFLRIDGDDLSYPVMDRKEISGPLSSVLRRIDEVTLAHIRTAVRFSDRSIEQNRPDYPISALQQLLRNAVLHRNYETSNAPTQWYWFSDRVEIHNPGGLYGRANEETFGAPGGNDYRNPTLAGALHRLGFVQRFGAGVPIARRSCRENGNPEPIFTHHPSTFGVTVKSVTVRSST